MICEPAMPHVAEIVHLDQLEDLRLKWQALVARMPEPSLFHTLDWLQTYWQHFGTAQRLRVLAVTSGPDLVGILPLTVIREPTWVGRLRVLTYPLQDWGRFFSPIGPNPTATLTLGLAHLHASPRDWDLLDLRGIDRDEQDHYRTPWALEHAGFHAGERVWREHPMVDIEGSWQSYWHSRSHLLREELAEHTARLRTCGDIEYVRHRPGGSIVGDDDPHGDLFDACVEIARNAGATTSPSGPTLADERVQAFLRDVHAAAADRGMLDLNLLRVDGRPIAFLYHYDHGGRLVCVQQGVRTEWAEQGALGILRAHMLADSFDRRDRTVDLPGAPLAWCTRVVTSYRYTHYSLRAPRVQLLRWQDWTRHRPPAALAPATS